MAMPNLRRLVLTFILCGALLPVFVASGAEVTKSDFVRQGNAICRQAADPLNQLERRFRKLLRQERFAAAGRVLGRAARIQLRTTARIADIPRPSQIAREIKRLLDKARAGLRLEIRVGRALVQGDLHKAQRLADRADRLLNAANRLSRQLGLRACADL